MVYFYDIVITFVKYIRLGIRKILRIEINQGNLIKTLKIEHIFYKNPKITYICKSLFEKKVNLIF